MRARITVLALAAAVCSMQAFATDYPAAKAPAVADGTGYVEIPGAEVAIDPAHVYKVIIDGTSAASKATGVLPALGRASLIVNALTVGRVPGANRKVVLIFHGPAVDGLLKNDGYHAQFGAPTTRISR